MNETRLWQFLEEHPGQSAPWCEWQNGLGDWIPFTGFERKFLQLTNQSVSAVNCRTDCGLSCPRRVVEHAADDIVAVCPEQEEKPYVLNKKDVLVYKLKRSSFHKSICSGLGIALNVNILDGIPGVCCVGAFTPTAGYSFSVYLTFKDNPDGLLESVRSISLLGQNPFVLIISTRKQLTPRIEDLLNRSCSLCLVLSEEFSIQNNGSLKALRSTTEVFAKFHSVVPDPDSGGMAHFDTPADISWNEITIRFVDGHRVSIKAGETHGTFDFSKMGMVSTKNSEPTKQWALLRAFAESYGQIDWQSHFASDKLKKQKQELSKRLREFFRLEDDPIEWVKGEKMYRCLFTILPENADEY